MSHSYVWEEAGLYRKFYGEVSGDEILESNFEVQGHEKFVSIEYVINDFLDVSSHSIKVSHTKAYASSDDIISKEKGALKIAIVVNNPALFDLAKNYQKLMHDNMFQCQIFSTLEDARGWAT